MQEISSRQNLNVRIDRHKDSYFQYNPPPLLFLTFVTVGGGGDKRRAAGLGAMEAQAPSVVC